MQRIYWKAWRGDLYLGTRYGEAIYSFYNPFSINDAMVPNLFYLAFLLLHWLVLPMEATAPKSKNGKAEKVSILNEQALEHLYEAPEKAKSLANEALRLSQNTDLKE